MNDLGSVKLLQIRLSSLGESTTVLRRPAPKLFTAIICILLAVWLWTGLSHADDPSFTSRLSFGTGLDKTWSLAVGDIDADGDLDILSGNGGDTGDQNRVERNDGHGGFAEGGAHPNFGTGADNTHSVAVGDMDGDGDLDLIVGNNDFQQSSVYLNDGRGAFNDPDDQPLDERHFGAGDSTFNVAVGDVDGDGDLDIVTGNDGHNVVYLNDGMAHFYHGQDACDAPPDEVRCFGNGEDNTRAVALGDVDGDGDLDIVTGNGGDEGEQNRVYLNDGAGNFATNNRFGTGEDSTRSVAVGDLNGDGLLDIVAGNYNQQNAIYVNDGTGNFVTDDAKPVGPVGDSTWSVAVGDVDGDGDLDIVVGNKGERNTVYLNDGDSDGDGEWDGTFASRGFGTGQDITRSVVLADVDRDSDLDIVTGNSGQQNVIYVNDGSGQYSTEDPPTFGTGLDNTSSVSIGDMNGDGQLDLIAGNSGQYNVVYLNDREGVGGFYSGPVDCDSPPANVRCFGSLADNTRAVAVGDMDGDGDLDIVGGQREAQSAVYLNDGAGSFRWPGSVRNFGSGSDVVFALAVGDVDRDGDLDIVTGSGGQPNIIYLNNGAGYFYSGTVNCSAPPSSAHCFGTHSDHTFSVALGDMNGDGHLDIATGNGGESVSQNFVYLNDGQGNFEGPGSTRTIGADLDGTRSVALGDMDGDSDLDVVVGNEAQQNVVFLNDGAGNLNWFGNARSFGAGGDSTTSLVVADVDGDGDLDIVTGNYNQQNVVYLNDGKGNFYSDSARTFGTGGDGTNSVAVGDLDRDGDADIATGNDGQNAVYLSRMSQPDLLVNNMPSVAVVRPGRTANGQLFSSPYILTDRFIPVSYTLSDHDGDRAGSIAAFYSFDGGGYWYPAVATSDTVTQNLTTNRISTPTLKSTHVFTWDTFASGVFGQSDNLVFRLETYPQPAHTGITGTHRYTETVPGPYQRPYASATTYPFRIRGTQVRVIQDMTLGTVKIAKPIANAMVYRRGKTESEGTLMADPGGRTYLTDHQGYLQGRGTIDIGDRLVAVLPITWTETYTLYHTSATPTVDGLASYTVEQAGVQTLTVSADNPLILFNLDVSLEWDARSDTGYMSELEDNIRKASRTLYDWTNGQAALGDVTIYHDRERWLESHVRIYATNRMRPNAAQGGIVSESITDPVTSTLSYWPGQIHIGAIWNRYGEPDGNSKDDWSRTLAHELGHYAFYLEDNYLGLDEDKFLVPVDTCPGAMSDPYRKDDASGFDEFHHGDDWETDCGDTLAAQSSGRWDWQTINTFYPQANGVITNAGPNDLPLAVTQLTVVEPVTPTTALEEPVFYTTQNGVRVQPSISARAFLFHGDHITDLGRPSRDQIIARGARPGDRVCLYELAQERLGCATVKTGDEQLALVSVPDWQPEVIVTPITSRTIAISVTNVPAQLDLNARLFPVNGDTPVTLGLTEGPTGTLSYAGYFGTFETEEPALDGFVQVWVNGEGPRREIVTDYSLGGNPGLLRGRFGLLRGRFGLLRGRFGRMQGRLAPSTSSDGHVVLFGLNLDFDVGEFYTLQAATTVPDPIPWATVIGQPYRLSTSPNAPDLGGTSLSFQYMGVEVPPEEEKWLRVYYWNGGAWEKLDTHLDLYHNFASARTQGPGVYALMSSIEVKRLEPPWDQFGYVVQESRPVTEALVSISGYYTTVVHYDASDPGDPWKIFDITAPDYVNDLRELEFGESYWIRVSESITLYLKGSTTGNQGISSATPQQATFDWEGAFPPLPATYYGALVPHPAFTPTVGMTITAMVNGNVCGETKTIAFEDEIVYAINVWPDGLTNGCGAPGRSVLFITEPYYLAPSPPWDNDRVQETPLHPLTHTFYLPMMTQSSESDQPWTGP